MITPADLQTAIAERLRETFPDEPVYETLTSQDFARPGNLVELSKITAVMAGTGSVKFQFQFKVSTFAALDESGNALPCQHALRSMTIMAAFGAGYIKVSGRAPYVESVTADTSMSDRAEVTLVLSLLYERSGFAPEELRSLMEELNMNTKIKEDDEVL